MFKKKKNTQSIEEMLNQEEGYEEGVNEMGGQQAPQQPQQPQQAPQRNNTPQGGIGLFEVEEADLSDIELDEEEEQGKGGKRKLVVGGIVGALVLTGGILAVTVMNKEEQVAPKPQEGEVVIDNRGGGEKDENLYEEGKGDEGGKVVDGGEVKNSEEVNKDLEEPIITEELTVDDVPVGGLTEYDKSVIRSEKMIPYTSEYVNISFEHSDTWYVSERSHEGIEAIQKAVGEGKDVKTFSLTKHKIEGVLPIVDFVLPNGGETMVLMQIGSEIERENKVREEAKKKGDTLYLATIPPVAHVKVPTSFVPLDKETVEQVEKTLKEQKDKEVADAKAKAEKDKAEGKEVKEEVKEYSKLSDVYTSKGDKSKKLAGNDYTLKKHYYNYYGTRYNAYELATKVGENNLYIMLYGMDEENLESALYRVEKMLLSLKVK